MSNSRMKHFLTDHSQELALILIIVVALNLIGDALQKQFDPKLK